MEGDLWSYTCTIPANTRVTFEIPASSADACKVNGKAVGDLSAKTDGIAFIGMGDGTLIFEAGSGKYGFVTKLG